MIVELRQYTLHPGARDTLIELFEREFVEGQEKAGMQILGTFRDAEDPDRFVWLRAFPDMESRRVALEAFYYGPVWKAHSHTANATMIDSDDVLLLHTVPVDQPQTPASPDYHIYVYPAGQAPATGPTVVARYESHHAENTFPRLPVRAGEDVVVLLTRGTAELPAPVQHLRLVPTDRSALR